MAAIASVYAGVLAPLVLLLVGVVLYLYKKVYTEVVEALPLNGGAYNCLLNSTSKLTASLAACITILSYIATAVISAKTAVEYLHHLMPVFSHYRDHYWNPHPLRHVEHYRNCRVGFSRAHDFRLSHDYPGYLLPYGICQATGSS